METENGIALAGVVIAFMALIRSLVKDFRERRESTQGLDKPSKGKGFFSSLWGSPIITYFFAILSILSSVNFLVNELPKEDDPITRHTIFFIALFTGIIFLNIVMILATFSRQQAERSSNVTSDAIGGILDLQQEIISLQKAHTQIIEYMSIIMALENDMSKDTINKRKSLLSKLSGLIQELWQQMRRLD